MILGTQQMHNAHVTLIPMVLDDAPELFEAAGCPDTFRYFSKIPTPWSAKGVRALCRFLIDHPEVRPFTVRLASTGEVVGSTTFCDLRPDHLGAEIGWTWYRENARGTIVNPACKILLLSNAFDGGLFSEPAERVCLKTDARNARSRAAILRLGASFEGILRRQLHMPDGHWRDSAYYSILRSEWPVVRERLQHRISTLP